MLGFVYPAQRERVVTFHKVTDAPGAVSDMIAKFFVRGLKQFGLVQARHSVGPAIWLTPDVLRSEP